MNNEENPTVPATDAPAPQPQAATSDAGSAVQTQPFTDGQPPGPADGTAASAPAPAPAESVPERELPADILELDAQVEAALKMVAHGASRLSKLAGNIRFSFLQRDEARLVSERKHLKTGYATHASTEAELKFGLKTVLQKAERLAGSLLHVPAASAPKNTPEAAATTETTDATAQAAVATETADAAAATPAPPAGVAPEAASGSSASPDAGNGTRSSGLAPDHQACPTGDATPEQPFPEADGIAPVAALAASPPDEAPAPASPAAPSVPAQAPVLSVQRSGQIRQAVRKSMMALAPAAPLHLQIELAPEFSDADPDIMAMAARIHAVHRQVPGSLRTMRWHSPVRCTLGFEDDKTLLIEFGDQGIRELPAAFRQNRQPAASGNPRTRERSGKENARSQLRGAQGNRRPGRDQQRPKSGGNGNAAAQTEDQAREGAPRNAGKGHRNPRAQAVQQGDNRNPQGKPRQHGRPRPQGEQGQEEARKRHTGRPQDGDRSRSGRHPSSGGAPRPGRSAFPGNSAMADKLREALGGLNLSQQKRDGKG